MSSTLRVRPQAFTLIELLIVVAIIAILAAIAIPNMLEAQVRAKVSRERADIRTVATALEVYAVDNNHYPPMLGNKPNGGTPWTANNLRNGYGSIRVATWCVVPNSVTTPIAYLSSIFPDAFKINGRDLTEVVDSDQNKPYNNTSNPTDLGLSYENIWDLAEDGITVPGSFFNMHDVADYGYWRLMSIGPDGTYNRIGTSSFVPLGWLYDPTNGTVSGGMIARTQRQTQVTVSHTSL